MALPAQASAIGGNHAGKGDTQMKTRYGTSYFVSISHAAMYYRDYEGRDGYRTAQRKLAAGEIHVGKPALQTGQRLLTIDSGTRYAIEEA